MTIIKKLTSDEFEVIRPHLERFEEKNIEAVRRILVDGAKQKDIAQELKATKQTVSVMVSRAWSLHMQHGSRPLDWEKVEVVLPPEYAQVVRDLADAVRRNQK
jgi:orotate phosphoribosyltransferase-like protein